MKIGIVTFHAAYNYGAVLQAYALQTHLQKLGHEPFFIDYQYRWDLPDHKGIRRWISRTPRTTIIKIHEQLKGQTFRGFQNTHLDIGSCKYNGIRQLRNAPPIADAYICGSDQIWNPNFIWESDEPAVWLNFGNKNVRRIAYAGSFGVSTLSYDICSRWSSYATCFYAISVREKNGIDIMKTLGWDAAVWVPDPTLLLDIADYYIVELQTESYNPPYLFSYQLGSDTIDLACKVKATVRAALHLACHEVRPNSFVHTLFHGGFIEPGKWISLLRQSRFVVTNSFHGLMFSLIYHLPFIVLLRSQMSGEMNSRVTSILEVVDMQDRAVALFDRSHVVRLCHEEIKWDQVDVRLREFREIGYRFIRDALA